MSGPERNSGNKWTDDDDRRLLELKADRKSNRAIADILKRSAAAVEQRFYLLRAKHSYAHEGPEKMPKSKGRKMQITRRALIQRINRKLKPDRKMLRATRAGRIRLDFGNYHVIDFRINAVTHTMSTWKLWLASLACSRITKSSPTTEQEKKSRKFLAIDDHMWRDPGPFWNPQC